MDFRLRLESLKNRSLLTAVIAIIDSGVDIYHEALRDHIWRNPVGGLWINNMLTIE